MVIVVGFALVKTLFERLHVRVPRWQVRGIDDPAGLPLAAVLITSYMTLLTPVLNSIVRAQEYEADLYGINASAQPDGEAQVALKLGEYRKLDPGPIEEWVFYDHPSGRTRIYSAMRWKAEHPEAWTDRAEARKPPSQ